MAPNPAQDGAERLHPLAFDPADGPFVPPSRRPGACPDYAGVPSAYSVNLGGGPLVMGVLNVTPDSFSDGGRYLERDRAIARAIEMIDEGADIVDIGPESTRPGAEPVHEAEQIARAVPVIEALRATNARVRISIDTRLANVAEAAVKAGADLINDVSALRDDPRMVEVVAESGARIVLMHRRGPSANMQKAGGPHYDDVVTEIAAFLDNRRRFAVAHGIDPSRIILDPGIGFGKRVEHNLLILRHLDRFVALGQPVMVGASRKSFMGEVLGAADPAKREARSLACVVIAILAGVTIVRVHDVRPAAQAVQLCRAVQAAEAETRQPEPRASARARPAQADHAGNRSGASSSQRSM